VKVFHQHIIIFMELGINVRDIVDMLVNRDVFDIVWDFCIARDTTENSVWNQIDDNTWEFIDPRVGSIIYPLADKYKYGDW
jgi:hypothetical protein